MTKTNAFIAFVTATTEVAQVEELGEVVQLTSEELNLIGGGEPSVITI